MQIQKVSYNFSVFPVHALSSGVLPFFSLFSNHPTPATGHSIQIYSSLFIRALDMLSATWISISVALLFAGQALGHGKLTSPSPRSDTIGSAFSEACGSQLLSVETSDAYGNIQQEMQTSTVDSSICNLWLCKGYQFADNEANVQSYTAGQTVSMTAEIRAPHTGVSTSSQTLAKHSSLLLRSGSRLPMSP